MNSGSTSSHHRLHKRAAFLAAGGEMLSGCRDREQPLSLAVIEIGDLPEVREIYGQDIAREVIARLVGMLDDLAGSRGLAGRTGVTQFCVLIPLEREKAAGEVERVFGKPARIEFDSGECEVVLVPDVVVDCADVGIASLETLCDEMARELALVRRDELRRHHYLQWERERHSQPASMHSNPASVAPRD
jgi:GGDEF domain-containing protein